MLDVSKLLCRPEELAERLRGGRGAAAGGRFGGARGPVVVWNITRRCNLACRHCYAEARAAPDPEELTTAEAHALLHELGRCGVPAVIFSGGDPLLRPDLLDLVRHAAEVNVHAAISTNGTLIDGPAARRLRAAGAGYVGVSLDGIGPRHDRFRGSRGAYQGALRGLRHCRDEGLAVGLRFSLSRATLPDLPRVLDLMEAEGVQRGYLSHLVYVGRARRLSPTGLTPPETRAAVETIFARAESLHRRGVRLDLVTGNNDADGVFLYLRVRRLRPAAAPLVYDLLRRRRGNSAGRTVANVDFRGGVHPDQFWPHHPLGNVRDRPFGEIWGDEGQPLLARLRRRRPHIGGRCARCPFFELCGAGSRVRAEALAGDLWASDPACYLTDDELGLAPSCEESHHASFRPTVLEGPDPLLPERAGVGARR